MPCFNSVVSKRSGSILVILFKVFCKLFNYSLAYLVSAVTRIVVTTVFAAMLHLLLSLQNKKNKG